MAWRLKKRVEAFRVVDGPFAGRRYQHGVQYEEIPPEEKARFEKVPEPAPKEKDKGAKEVKK